jgi:Dolichyl-phosphate-mannose-protein mannosyltransferase
LNRRLLALLLGIQLVRAVLYALLLPLWQNPDEWVHFEYVELLAYPAIRLDLPVDGTLAYRLMAALGRGAAAGAAGPTHSDLRREIGESLVRHRYWEIRRFPDPNNVETLWYSEFDQLPLYYLVAAGVLRVVSPGSIDGAAYTLRFLSVAFSVAIVALAYRVARELIPDRPAVAFATAGLITFTPQFTSLSGGITNDKLVEVAFAGVILLTVRLARQGLSWPGWAGLAALIGTGLLTKKSGWILVPILLSWWDLRRFRQRGGGWRRYAMTRLGFLAALATLFLTARLWLLPMAEFYGRHEAALPAVVTASLDALRAGFRTQFQATPSEFIVLRADGVRAIALPFLRRYYFPILFRGYWANFGHMEVPVADTLYRVLMLAIGAAALGLGLLVRDAAQGRGRWRPWQQDVMVFWAGSVFWVVLLTFLRDAPVLALSQGRNIYPVVIPLAVFFVLGLTRVARRAGDWRVCWILLAGLAAFDAICIVHYVIPFFYGVTLVGVP